MRTLLTGVALLSIVCAAPSGVHADGKRAENPAAVYDTHCAVCHGAERLGAIGPALLPESLGRLKKTEAATVIRAGRPATQMPPFGAVLSPEAIEAVAAWLYESPATAPGWGLHEIRQSRIVYADPATLSSKPTFKADRWNLFVVVEAGDHHVTVLDGDTFTPLTRFASRFALHGGPKFTPDGRFVFFGSRDGWITKYDLFNLRVIAEVRAGVNMRNIAVSGDGKYVIAGNYLPNTVVIFDAATLAVLKVFSVEDAAGHPSRVSAVYTAAPRESFIVALKDLPELWEISYAPKNTKGAWVHNYEKESGDIMAVARTFDVRRIASDDIVDDFFFDAAYRYAFSSGRKSKRGQVIDLDHGRKVTDVALPGMPHLGSGITWERDGHTLMATPNLQQGLVTVIDMTNWSTVADIATPGPGFFMRSHENTPYAWTDGMMGPKKDTMVLIDKQSLKVVRELTPAPGKTAAHVEFTNDGRYALVSIWEQDGELVVYDAKTLEIVKRLPMVKPSGKYNVSNKVNRSTGTSH